MVLMVQMVWVRSRWKARCCGSARSRWKARCCGGGRSGWKAGGPVETKKIRWKPGFKVEIREERGRMGGAVAGVSQELSLDLERRVATEVVY